MGIYNFLVAFPNIESVLHLPIPGVRKFRRFAGAAGCDRRPYHLHAGGARWRARARRRARDGATCYRCSWSRDTKLRMGAPAPETGMNDTQIRDEVLTIFLAGYETVANALTWTWYLLSQNPEAEAKLSAELEQVLGPADGGALRLPTLSDIPQLRYTEMVFAESMRLYPPAWAMGRMSTAPVTLGPYRIPAGAHFFFSQYMVHRSPEYFPDPLRFDPERPHAGEQSKAGQVRILPFRGRVPTVYRRVVRLDGGDPRSGHHCEPVENAVCGSGPADPAGEDYAAAEVPDDDGAPAALNGCRYGSRGRFGASHGDGRPHCQEADDGMKKMAWVWFAGFAAWLIDGGVSVHYRNLPHARLAFMLAMLFLAAGLFYRQQRS